MNLIRHFVKEDTKVTFEIQEEMVDNHTSLHNTLAGKSVDMKLAEERATFERTLREVEAELGGAIRKKDADFIEVLKELRQAQRQNLDETIKSQESLRVIMERLHERRYAELEKPLAAQAEAYQKLLAFSQILPPLPFYYGPNSPLQSTPQLCDPAAGRIARTLGCHNDSVLAVSFSPDGRLLASASGDKDRQVVGFRSIADEGKKSR
ncbi:hypothetical protein K432DRAFT_400244 [Lepidopterella palustris CBS 459.81]|uniref:Uncharacterized protein n=1 Tax=Lepidopterella palustris CBS 459.81 TaxID=1314670 RepID=A0A8E2JKN0_9PEZI|nr:hypothetical protein K432DRAFT_400244 [Lepidopterella palustris CBS 459.81]